MHFYEHKQLFFNIINGMYFVYVDTAIRFIYYMSQVGKIHQRKDL